MRQLLLLILVSFLGTLFAEDPGVVFISFHQQSIEFPLWLLLITGFLSFELLLIIVRIIYKFSSRYEKHTLKAMLQVAEGNYKKAEKIFVQAAVKSLAVPNLIMAAQMADLQGNDNNRMGYLDKAKRLLGKDNLSIELLAIEYHIKHQEWQLAEFKLQPLLRYRKHPQFANLYSNYLYKTNQYALLFKFLQQLPKKITMPDLIVTAANYQEALRLKDNGEVKKASKLLEQLILQQHDSQAVLAYSKLDLPVKNKLRFLQQEQLKELEHTVAYNNALALLYEELEDKELAAYYRALAEKVAKELLV